MEHFNFYCEQLQRRKQGINFDANKEIFEKFNLKSGKFAEKILVEVTKQEILTTHDKVKIIRKDGIFIADGYSPKLDCFFESKNFAFNSRGTASEKLPNFLIKAEEYTKPVVLVLGGEHELLTDEASFKIWEAFHNPEYSSSKSVLALINAVKHNIKDIVKLSQMKDWYFKATQAIL